MNQSARRFPPPWRAERIPGGYVVRDAGGQVLAYVYGRESEAEARQANVHTPLAANIARLPELLGAGRQ